MIKCFHLRVRILFHRLLAPHTHTHTCFTATPFQVRYDEKKNHFKYKQFKFMLILISIRNDKKKSRNKNRKTKKNNEKSNNPLNSHFLIALFLFRAHSHWHRIRFSLIILLFSLDGATSKIFILVNLLVFHYISFIRCADFIFSKYAFDINEIKFVSCALAKKYFCALIAKIEPGNYFLLI